MKLHKILTSDDIVSSINENMDYLLEIIPEIKYMIGFDQKHPHHHLDVWQHTLLALELSENDFEIRLCLLLHDIGKPFSYQDGEVRHFKGHAKVSANMAREILNRLEFNDKFISEVCYLIKYHDMPISEVDVENDYDLPVKRYKIQWCDALAHNPEKLEKRKDYLEKTKKLIEKNKIKM